VASRPGQGAGKEPTRTPAGKSLKLFGQESWNGKSISKGEKPPKNLPRGAIREGIKKTGLKKKKNDPGFAYHRTKRKKNDSKRAQNGEGPQTCQHEKDK